MPIQVSCSCGKSIAAPDKFAGKKIKCPQCAKPLAIPASQTPDNSKSAQKTAAPPTKTIRVECDCGKKFDLKPALAGKSIKCTSCAKVLKIPALNGGKTAKAIIPSSSTASAPVAVASSGSGDIGDLLDDVDLSASTTGLRCPECRSEVKEETVLCVVCGFHLERGRKLSTKTIEGRGNLVAEAKKAGNGASGKKPPVPATVSSLASIHKAVGWLQVILSILLFAVTSGGLLTEGNLGDAASSAAITGFIVGFGAVIAIFSFVVGTIPNLVTAHLLTRGNSMGWILSVILGVLYIPSIIGIFILMKCFNAEVKQFCGFK